MMTDLLWYIIAVAIVTAVIMTLFYVANVVLKIIFEEKNENKSHDR